MGNACLTEEVWSLLRDSQAAAYLALICPVRAAEGGFAEPGKWFMDFRVSCLPQPVVSLVTWANSLSLASSPTTLKTVLLTLEAVCADCMRCTFGFMSWCLSVTWVKKW